jgi:hypothetical protein
VEGRALSVMSRVPGYRAPRPGDDVHLSVEGPVMAYPQAAGEAAVVNSDPQIAQFLKGPMSVATLGIKEHLS